MDAKPVATSGCRIAVLEDTLTTRKIIERLLMTRFHCAVDSYATAEDLDGGCTHMPPDLFLLDVMLGGEITGIDVCRRLQDDERTRNIPVVFLSEHNQPQMHIEALRAGGVDYVYKPFYPEEFLLRIQGCLERFLRQKQIDHQRQEQMALLRVLCHDLRNSVGASMSALEQLPEIDNDADRRELLGICHLATKSAMDLIVHVSEYRMLLDAAHPLKVSPVEVTSACDEAVTVMKQVASRKNINLTVRSPGGLRVIANRVVLVHNILINLLTNAIKFSRPGGTVWIEADEKMIDGVLNGHIAVRDEGIGIPPQILTTLLKSRLVPSRPGTDHESGTGIGMTLVQLYTARCGGSVYIESQAADPSNPGTKTGSCVHLYFPSTVAA